MWTSCGESTASAAGAICLSTSKRVSLIALESGVFDAAVQEKRWSPMASIVFVLEHRHFWGQCCVGSLRKSGSLSFRLIAVRKTWLEYLNFVAVRGSESAILVSGDRRPGRNIR